VAYRRKYVRALFDYISPILGDDLTNSEDIFIGFSMLNEGYRNIQLTDVYARTVEPEVQKLPRQIYLWSSSFLQSCYYFDSLVRSPFSAVKRWIGAKRASWNRRQAQTVRSGGFAAAVPAAAGLGSVMAGGFPISQRGVAARVTTELSPREAPGGAGPTNGGDRRIVREPYRQAFGRARTESHGRPAGWILLMSAAEKVFFPTTLLIMLILRHWEALALTVACETTICIAALAFVMKGRRLEYALKGLAVTPLRYALLASEMVTIGRFASDLWITNNRKWRK
jgi:hypothetical protein